MREIPSAAERARWLAEVAQALDQAWTLLERMENSPGDRRERVELAHRIATAKQMTRSLRLSSNRRAERGVPPQ